MIDALLASLALKAVDRAGWKRVGIADPESVAAHSWGVSLLALTLAPEELDRGRLLTYAALHDLPECRAGDITPHDGVSRADKHAAEVAALSQLGELGLPPHLAAAWHDYEAQADAEARFVRQLDRLDMALQALLYAPRAEVREFVASAERYVDHPVLVPLLAEVRSRLEGVG